MNSFLSKDMIEFSNTVRVLFVEDKEEYRKDTLLILSKFFKNIDVAVDGLDGYDNFKSKKYDLIITDIDMPKLNGVDMIAKIRKISKHITVLIISPDEKNFIDVIRQGIDGYILQPIEKEQFVTTITKVIERLKNKQELYEYKNSLEETIEKEIARRTDSEAKLMQQSKLAAMGEMIDAVAHQWKQPLNTMSMQVDYLQYDFEDGVLDAEKIRLFQESFTQQKDHMVNTLSEFRSFFRPNKDTKQFKVEDCIKSVLVLVRDEFAQNHIEIEVNITNSIVLDGVENEFKHVILNLINNSKDAFNENNIENKQIIITLIEEDNERKIIIQDNAGGIPEHIINKVFDINVTAKANDKGTGIGLYMTQQIVEKNAGIISVANIGDGATFTILL